MISDKLRDYLYNAILPCYDTYDKGHGRDHILEVVDAAVEISASYDVDMDMVYTAAVFHDLGLVDGRELHHLTSAKMLRADSFIQEYFSADQIDTIADAIEDHRASAKDNPRSVYGEIISSADRVINIDTIIMRSYYHSEQYFPLYTMEEHLDRVYSHIKSKYSEGGYMKLPILTQQNRVQLLKFRDMVADENRFKSYSRDIIEKNC